MNTDKGTYYEGEAVAQARARGEPLIPLPHPPDKACPRCDGAGTVQNYDGTYAPCPHCYPDHPVKPKLSFKNLLREIMRRK